VLLYKLHACKSFSQCIKHSIECYIFVSMQVWLCDFCGTPNNIDVLPGEIPTLPDVTYMISPAPTTSGSSFSGTDESLVIFCVDISGSMCVSQEVS